MAPRHYAGACQMCTISTASCLPLSHFEFDTPSPLKYRFSAFYAGLPFRLTSQPDNLEVFSMQEYETLKKLVDEAAEDVNKAAGGNKAAGTRVRKKMQEIKAAAQDVRKKILEGRDDEGAEGAEPTA